MLLPMTARKTACGFTGQDWERPRLSQTAYKTPCHISDEFVRELARRLSESAQSFKVEPAQKDTKKSSNKTPNTAVYDTEPCFPDGPATIGIHHQIERLCFTTTTYKTLAAVDNILTFLFFATKHPLTLSHEYPTSTILSKDGRKALLELQRQISDTSINNWEAVISQFLQKSLDMLFPDKRAREVLRTKEFIRHAYVSYGMTAD
jgi:hypothetical protein